MMLKSIKSKKKILIIVIIFLVLIAAIFLYKNPSVIPVFEEETTFRQTEGIYTTSPGQKEPTLKKQDIDRDTEIKEEKTDIKKRSEEISNYEEKESKDVVKIRDPFQKKWEKKISTTNGSVQRTEQEKQSIKEDNIDKRVEEIKDGIIDGNDDLKAYTYQDLYNMTKKDKSRRKDINDNEEESQVESIEKASVTEVIEYPPYQLKGVVIKGEVKKAVLFYEGQTYILTVGDIIDEWQIEDIAQNEVVLTGSKGDRFIMTLEGVALDEE